MGGDIDGERRSESVRHLYVVDLVRFVAAGAVAVFHLTWNNRYFPALPPVGWIGVEIFFVISGYVIAGSMAGASTADFVRKRVLRLYPAGWICTIISLIALLTLGTAQQAVGVYGQAGKAAFVFSMALFGDRFVATAYWTLPVELAFYAVMAALLAIGRPGRVASIAKLLILAGALYMLALIGAQAGRWPGRWLHFGYGLKNALLLRHGVYFALGIILYRKASGDAAAGETRWAALALFVGGAEIYDRAVEVAAKSPAHHGALMLFALGGVAWLVALAALANAGRLNALVPSSPAIKRGFRSIGLATYPLYLLHESVAGSLMGAAVLHGVHPVAALLLALGACFGVSLVVCLALEPPLRRYLSPLLFRAPTRARQPSAIPHSR